MSDDTLLNEFVQAGDETAFAALVRRHMNLVYATARRQVGDTTLAEEISQNVFIALARKSGALLGSATISGWLYRTTLLESRQALRAQLRRHRREAAAIELGQLGREDETPWGSVVPLLDEALTKLREGDRLAVLLRFLEQKPFHEVGQALGISEDAAQKRVTRSLSALTAFFQRRGFRVSCTGAAGASLFAEATLAAPAHLATEATQAAMAAAGGTHWSGVALLVYKIMHLPKLPTAIACTVLATIPVAFEAQELRSARDDLAAFSARRLAADQTLAEAESRRDELARRVRAVASQPVPLPTPPMPQPQAGMGPAWIDNSPFARVSKELLARIKVNGLGRDWKIKSELSAILALSPDQSTQLQGAVDGFFAELSTLEEAHLELLPAEPEGDGNSKTAPTKITLRINRYEPEANAARIRLKNRLSEFLGASRTELALRYLDLAPAQRPSLEPGEAIPDGDYFELSSHGSDRWNFHGYERTITLTAPRQPRGDPELMVNVKFGSQDGMSFGAGSNLFNPASAPSLRQRWDALIAR